MPPTPKTLADQWRSERGATLILVGLSIFMLTAMSAFVLDYGVMWMARRQAQNSADAAALAGATSLAFDNATDFSTTGPAYLAAQNTAQRNPVFSGDGGTTGLRIDVDPTTTWVPPAPPACAAGGCIQVNTYRDATNGSTRLPTYFAALFGQSSQQVRATATAQAQGANTVRCLKPWGVLDKWTEGIDENGAPTATWRSGEGTDTPISTFDKYFSQGASSIKCATSGTPPNCAPTVDNYVPATTSSTGTTFTTGSYSAGQGDMFRRISLTVGKQNVIPTMPTAFGENNPFVAGWFIPISWGTGTGDYQAAITGCVEDTVSIDQPLTILNVPGNREQKTADAVGCETCSCSPPSLLTGIPLFCQDSGARWDSSCNCITGSAFALSPRIVPIALISPDEYITGLPTGSSTVMVRNLVGGFIDGWDTTTNKIIIHIMPIPGEFLGTGGSVAAGASFVKMIVLVR